MWARILVIFNQWQRQRAITKTDILHILRQFSTLLVAGIPIIQSCDLLEKSQTKNAARLMLYAIKRDLLAGKNVYHAFGVHSQHFDELTRQLVRMGEQTGKLASILNTLADHHENRIALQRKIHQALFYPCLLIITAILIMLCLLLFVIPHFAELFQTTTIQLPIFTRALFYLAELLRQGFVALLAISVLLVILLFYLKRSRLLQPYCTHFFLHLPLVRTCWRYVLLTRFARHLALTFAAGLPIHEALRLTAHAAGDMHFAEQVSKLNREVCAGRQIHQALAALPVFPPLLIQMVKVGEESGMLALMLEKASVCFEAEVETRLVKLCQLLEPLIILVLGVLIGGLVIGMYLPIFKLGSAF